MTIAIYPILHHTFSQTVVTVPIILYPSWAKKEFDWIYSQLKGQQLLFSRMDGGRRLSVATTSGKTFWLDNDVIGMLLPSLLNGDDIQIEHLISGVSIMRQTALMVLISSALGIPAPKLIHFLPRVNFNANKEASSITSSVEKFGSHRVNNALLWCAASGRQNIVLDENLFSRMLDREPEPTFDLAKLRRSILVR